MPLSKSSIDYVLRLVSAHAGWQFDPSMAAWIESRLLPVALERGISFPNELIKRLEMGLIPLRTAEDSPDDLLVQALTDEETYFFRDFFPFDALEKKIIPDLKAKRASEQKLTIWCIGCSTGQEPYSIAMLLRQHFPELLAWKLEIIATDISVRALDYAREGSYDMSEISRGLPAPVLLKHFRKEDSRWRIHQQIREMVSFSLMNLTEPWPPVSGIDLVLLRNVLSSLRPSLQKDVLRRVGQRLRPDGCLFLGHTEVPGAGGGDFFDAVVLEKCVYYLPKPGLGPDPELAPAPDQSEPEDLSVKPWIRVAGLAANFRGHNLGKLAAVFGRDQVLEAVLMDAAARSSSASTKRLVNTSDALAHANREMLLAVALTNPLADALDQTFSEMLSSGVERLAVSTVMGPWPKEVSITTRFSGDISGAISLRMEPQTAMKLTAGLVGLPEDEVPSEMLQEIMCPLLNGSMQKLEESLNAAGITSKFELAEFHENVKPGQRPPADAGSQTLAFKHDDQLIAVELWITA